MVEWFILLPKIRNCLANGPIAKPTEIIGSCPKDALECGGST